MRGDLFSLVNGWTKRRFLMESGYYAGRGPTPGDLNSGILEDIYQGIKKDVSAEAATNFVRFVNALDDLSASAFIVAFERFWASDCMEVRVTQHPSDRDRVSGHGDARDAQAFAVVAVALSGGRKSDAEVTYLSLEIKRDFIRKYLGQIPNSERRLLGLEKVAPPPAWARRKHRFAGGR